MMMLLWIIISPQFRPYQGLQRRLVLVGKHGTEARAKIERKPFLLEYNLP